VIKQRADPFDFFDDPFFRRSSATSSSIPTSREHKEQSLGSGVMCRGRLIVTNNQSSRSPGDQGLLTNKRDYKAKSSAPIPRRTSRFIRSTRRASRPCLGDSNKLRFGRSCSPSESLRAHSTLTMASSARVGRRRGIADYETSSRPMRPSIRELRRRPINRAASSWDQPGPSVSRSAGIRGSASPFRAAWRSRSWRPHQVQEGGARARRRSE